MQLTPETISLYKEKAPELLDAVDSGEAEFIMKRDPITDYCVKFDAGWCGIHRDYGPEFLGDACNFYPRITRALNDTVVTTMALSCPEAARLMLYDSDAFAATPREELRVPFSLKNYLPAELAPEDALALHQLFIDQAGNETVSAERCLMRVGTVARALETQPLAQWLAAAKVYFTMADGRLLAPQAQPHDMVQLTQALAGLIVASKASSRTGLMDIIHVMEEALGITIDLQTRGFTMAPDAMERGLKLLHGWQKVQASLQPVLHRYLQAQLSQAMFPFAGLGSKLGERTTIIGVRLATVKLALMAAAQQAGGAPDEAEVVRIIYTLSRFLDHLADPALSLSIYSETGWVLEARLRALLGDA
jgi:hypothetical protein